MQPFNFSELALELSRMYRDLIVETEDKINGQRVIIRRFPPKKRLIEGYTDAGRPLDTARPKNYDG